MEFTRKISIEQFVEKGRVIMVYGPRRVGKTTMVQQYLQSQTDKRVKYDVGDDLQLRKLMNSQIRRDILDYVQPYDVIAIDEAQQIEHIGLAAKMIIDTYPEKVLILTGSSSFDLAQSVGEPLVGRQYIVQLMPLAWSELAGSNYEKKQKLSELLTYGSYPEILRSETAELKQKKLQELVSSYLYKDILSFDRLRSPELLVDIVKSLAFQIGSEVSINKLAKNVGESDPKKIKRYLDVLEKAFVIKKVKSFSKNPRNEISKMSKYYFYDVGIRNAVIGRFQGMENRDPVDIGGLWENYVYMELYKKNISLGNGFDSFYFWRDKKGHEIDIVIESLNSTIDAYECKWSKTNVVFTEFLDNYPTASVHVVHRENCGEFLDLD